MDAALRALRHRFGSMRGRWWLPGPIGSAHQPIDNRKHGDKEEELGHGVKFPRRIGRGERIRTSDSCVPNGKYNALTTRFSLNYDTLLGQIRDS